CRSLLRLALRRGRSRWRRLLLGRILSIVAASQPEKEQRQNERRGNAIEGSGHREVSPWSGLSSPHDPKSTSISFVYFAYFVFESLLAQSYLAARTLMASGMGGTE